MEGYRRDAEKRREGDDGTDTRTVERVASDGETRPTASQGLPSVAIVVLKKLKRQGFVHEETNSELLGRFTLSADQSARRAEALAMRLGVDPELPPRERAVAIRKALRRVERPHPKQWAWGVLRERIAGGRTDLEAIFAANALGLGIREALAKAADGWGPLGAPKATQAAMRDAGSDFEEDGA